MTPAPSEESTDGKGGVRNSLKPKSKKRELDRNGERFYCPYPGCTRSFAELWRLKVHYRAPPDVRGSGKERGHGQELTQCPRCGKTLVPGKHHTGCSHNPSLSGALENEKMPNGALKPEHMPPEAVNGWGGLPPYQGAFPEWGPGASNGWHPSHGPPGGARSDPCMHPSRRHQPVHPMHSGGAFGWPAPPELSGFNALSTCSTSTALVGNDQASSWHIHSQQMAPYQQQSAPASSGGEGAPVALPPMRAVKPSHNDPRQVTRTHWRAWAECSMQTDLGAPFWPLDAPFPGFPPRSGDATVADAVSQPAAETPRAPGGASFEGAAPLELLDPQQSSACDGVVAGDSAPPPAESLSHPKDSPQPDAPRPSHARQPPSRQRSVSNAPSAPSAWPPASDAGRRCVPHPPSSPPDDNFDHLANMLFDFSHFDSSVKKELTSGEVPLHPVPEDFMDEFYGVDIAHDDQSMFKILFEDEHHNATSITTHMHRQREWSFNLDDPAMLAEGMHTSDLENIVDMTTVSAPADPPRVGA